MTQYYRPDSLEKALDILEGSEKCTILAGGTDIIVDKYKGEIEYGDLLDIGGISKLRGISIDGEGITIGACTTFKEIEESDCLKKYASVLCSASSQVGSPQIRSKGTIGGNICNANPSADTVPALIALQAILVLSSRTGVRTVSVLDFITERKKTLLKKGELLTQIRIRIPKHTTISRFEKVGRRNSLAIARMSAACVLETDGGMIESLQIAVGAVAAKPLDFSGVCGDLRGEELLLLDIDRLITPVMHMIEGSVHGRSTSAYKVPVIRDVLNRMMCSMIQEAKTRCE